MKTVFYKIDCLTNLHVGSGEINYNIVDGEVEKDAVTGLPMIHASGVKGALRDALSTADNKAEIETVFGKTGAGELSGAGTHKFLDAYLISRPMRVRGSDRYASLPVVSVSSVNAFLERLRAFLGEDIFGIGCISQPDFGDNAFLTTVPGVSVENEKTGMLSEEARTAFSKLESVIGKDFAVVRDLNAYDLPVTARNCLDEKGRSINLWYEEVVPHGSVLYFGIIYPDGAPELDLSAVIQFGGNASIGCGYTKLTKLSREVTV